MKLLSTTLTGNSQDLIADALASVVPFVDACVVVDTGVTDETLARAEKVCGDKLAVRTFKWIDDFAAARNFALAAAAEVAKERFDASEPGGLWAIMVDTDERIDTHGEDVRAILAASNAECAMVMHHSETHVRERIFRLPAKGSFNGPTHEAYTAQPRDQLLVLEKTRCFELEKTPEDYQKKFERDARVLAAYTKENPWDPRWFYYYGDALQSLRRFEEATAAYDECAKLRGWNEESAWACYRAAECWCALEKYEKAVDACAAGLARHSGIAELAWLAGYASWQLGKVDQAVFWSHLAISMGLFRGKGADVHRIGFRNVRALFEGPYDVLRYALRAMGDIVGADVAEVLMKEATAAREAYGRKAT